MPASDSPLDSAVLAELARPGAYRDDPSARDGVERLQTHISLLFLTKQRVYKFRRDVDLGFVCFRTRAERNTDCLNEVRLNRRLAPDVYLGVAPLVRTADGWEVGPIGEELVVESTGVPAEHCVVMRRLPAGRDALRLLEQGALTAEQLDRVARRVARFHDRAGLGSPAPISRERWFERCLAPIDECHAQLVETAPDAASRAAREGAKDRARAAAQGLAARFEERRQTGLAVDAHGDMHLEHVWFERDDAEPVIIDCLEFSEELRQIDAASEVAFTAMDLAYRGAEQLAERYLRIYARERGDFHLYSVVDFFLSYRAAVRAKIAAIAGNDAQMEPRRRERARESAERHLQLANRALGDVRPGALLIVGGSVGSGKSTIAEVAADAVCGVIISTDRVRKQEIGLAASSRPDAEAAGLLYSDAGKRATYARVIDYARFVLESGRPAVLDGTFSHQYERDLALELAAELGVACFFLEASCREEAALERLARREQAGVDASDAGPERLAQSVAEFESLHDWPAARHVLVRTDEAEWRERLCNWLAVHGAASAWNRRLSPSTRRS